MLSIITWNFLKLPNSPSEVENIIRKYKYDREWRHIFYFSKLGLNCSDRKETSFSYKRPFGTSIENQPLIFSSHMGPSSVYRVIFHGIEKKNNSFSLQ